jgi:hypothetical protein
VNEAFRVRLKTLSNSEIFVLTEAASAEPRLDYDRGYWACIHELQQRSELAVVERCLQWATSSDANHREASAHILGRLAQIAAGIDRNVPRLNDIHSVLEVKPRVMLTHVCLR